MSTSKKRGQSFSVTASWRRIESWLKARAPAIYERLPPPASQAQLTQLSESLGVPLPKALRELLELRNGTSEQWMHDSGPFLATEQIQEAWGMLTDLWGDGHNDAWARDAPKGVRRKWWSRKWVPVTHDWGGDHLVLDLEPARGGHTGQLFQWLHDGGPSRTVAKSLEALLARFADELEAGAYEATRHSAGHTSLVRKSG